MTQSNKNSKRQLIVFVKAPEPGQCKTRLTPFLSEVEASEFYESLVISCFENLNNLLDIDIAIYAYPDINHRFLQQLKSTYHTGIFSQQGNNLGERMFNAIAQSLSTYSESILIGTDCPVLDSNYINLAFNALAQHDMVIGPAIDGGYVLIGANKIQQPLFKNIDWGTNTVLTQSLKNISLANYSVKILETLWDIDTPDDYIKYQDFTKNLITGTTHE